MLTQCLVYNLDDKWLVELIDKTWKFRGINWFFFFFLINFIWLGEGKGCFRKLKKGIGIDKKGDVGDLRKRGRVVVESKIIVWVGGYTDEWVIGLIGLVGHPITDACVQIYELWK